MFDNFGALCIKGLRQGLQEFAEMNSFGFHKNDNCAKDVSIRLNSHIQKLSLQGPKY